MMQFRKTLISIVYAAFSGKAATISASFNWEKAISLAKEHNIAPVVYYGAVNCGVPKSEAYMKELRQLTLQSIADSTEQLNEIELIKKAFNESGIEYMLLKGIILKSIYPKPEMRAMGDADILIKLEQYPKIEKIVKNLGFTFKHESDHELIWTKFSLYLELHKRIMTSYNKDFYSYFGTGWKLAKRISDSTGFEMSKEDFYLYTFVHFTKHYRIMGIGIKHLLDLWVYACKYPDMNWEYIKKELEKMNLKKFYSNVQKTIQVWFNGDTETEVTEIITDAVFGSGQYGSKDQASINRLLQRGKKTIFSMKMDRILQRAFPPLLLMKRRYIILGKIPILLPVMWVIRFFQVLLFRQDRMKKLWMEIDDINMDKVENNKKALKDVGLDFDNNK